MVNVGMRKLYKIDRLLVECWELLVFQVSIMPALEHAAIHQKTYFTSIYQVTRAGNFSRRAAKRYFHVISLWISVSKFLVST